MSAADINNAWTNFLETQLFPQRIQFPALVIDVSFKRPPKGFPVETDWAHPPTVPVFEVAALAIENASTDLDDVPIWRGTNSAEDARRLSEQLASAKTIVSHNVKTDLSVLYLWLRGFGIPLTMEVIGNVFCTQEASLEVSTMRSYRGGSKSAKWLSLTQLYEALTGNAINKGGITDDVLVCAVCFLTLFDRWCAERLDSLAGSFAIEGMELTDEDYEHCRLIVGGERSADDIIGEIIQRYRSQRG